MLRGEYRGRSPRERNETIGPSQKIGQERSSSRQHGRPTQTISETMNAQELPKRGLREGYS